MELPASTRLIGLSTGVSSGRPSPTILKVDEPNPLVIRVIYNYNQKLTSCQVFAIHLHHVEDGDFLQDSG